MSKTGDGKKFGFLPARYVPYLVTGAFLLMGYEFYWNVVRPAASETSTPAHSGRMLAPAENPPRNMAASGRGEEFHPALRPKREEDRIRVEDVDPALRLDRLAKLQKQSAAGGRDLFNWGQAAAQPASTKTEQTVTAAETTSQPESGDPVAQPVSAPASINLKYYGLGTTLKDGRKTAFFLEDEQILLETKGVTFGTRYRLVNFGSDSAVVEDLESKRQQTLALVTEEMSQESPK